MKRKQYPYLQDTAFLKEIDKMSQKTYYVKLTVLSWDKEEPIQEIQGRVTSGGISIDGSSSLRRTLNLSVYADNIENDLSSVDSLFSINKKIYVEQGLVNNTKKYKSHEIVWFPLGLYIMCSLSISHTSDGVTLNLGAKDKMCLLNGECGGIIPAATTFDSYEILDQSGVYVDSRPTIYQIIQELVNHFGGEDLNRIIISDIDNQIKQGLTWTDSVNNLFILQYISGGETQYAVTASEVEKEEYIDAGYALIPGCPEEGFAAGDPIGYTYTSFTYPGELSCQPGATITSILDSIVSTLGNYEYFYDLDGVFHFQEIKNYYATSQAKVEIDQMNNSDYMVERKTGKSVYTFDDLSLVSSISSTPKYDMIKNDFVCWGSKKVNGQEYPIRYHLAIDEKPYVSGDETVDVFLDTVDGITKVIPSIAFTDRVSFPKTGTPNLFYIDESTNHIYDWDNYEGSADLSKDYYDYEERGFVGNQYSYYYDDVNSLTQEVLNYKGSNTLTESVYRELVAKYRPIAATKKMDEYSEKINDDLAGHRGWVLKSGNNFGFPTITNYEVPGYEKLRATFSNVDLLWITKKYISWKCDDEYVNIGKVCLVDYTNEGQVYTGEVREPAGTRSIRVGYVTQAPNGLQPHIITLSTNRNAVIQQRTDATIYNTIQTIDDYNGRAWFYTIADMDIGDDFAEPGDDEVSIKILDDTYDTPPTPIEILDLAQVEYIRVRPSDSSSLSYLYQDIQDTKIYDFGNINTTYADFYLVASIDNSLYPTCSFRLVDNLRSVNSAIEEPLCMFRAKYTVDRTGASSQTFTLTELCVCIKVKEKEEGDTEDSTKYYKITSEGVVSTINSSATISLLANLFPYIDMSKEWAEGDPVNVLTIFNSYLTAYNKVLSNYDNMLSESVIGTVLSNTKFNLNDFITNNIITSETFTQGENSYVVVPAYTYQNKDFLFLNQNLYYLEKEDDPQPVRGQMRWYKFNFNVALTTVPIKDWRTVLYLSGTSAEANGVYSNHYYTELKNEWPKQYNLAEGEFYPEVVENPNKLDFYLDFIDSGAAISEFSVNNIGRRSYIINDDKVNCVFEPKIPDLILIKKVDETNSEYAETMAAVQAAVNAGYSVFRLDEEYFNSLSTTINYNSAYQVVRQLLTQYTSYNKSISISCIPILYLDANTRITVRDPAADVNGDYIINNISFSLGDMSSMSISATQAIEMI